MANDSVQLIPREIREAGFSSARFLSEEEQAMYEKASCKSFSGQAYLHLNKSREGSNIFKVLFLNQTGIRTATLPELETALENGLALQGHYEDAREVVLRSAGDSYAPNDYLAKTLAKSLGVKRFTAPLVVSGLDIVGDDNSHYGLNFKPTDKTQVLEVPSLAHTNHERRFSRINPDYSIEFNDNGNRTLYTRQDGLSGLCLDWGLGLNSRLEHLECSDSYGRVVVVSAAEGKK
jgi:hypothetical protein